MPRAAWGTEVLNLNSQRAYPLTEDATKRSGDFVLPNDLILDIDFPIHAGLNVQPGGFYLRRLQLFGPGIVITIGYDDVDVATAIVPFAGHQEYDVYTLAGKGDFAASVGWVVIGKTTGLGVAAGGVYEFTYAAGKLEVACVRPTANNLSGLLVSDGSNVTGPLYGYIELRAGNNFRLTATAGDSPSIQFDAVSGDGLSEACECPSAEDTGRPIRSLSGLRPDDDGNIDLLGDDCIDIVVTERGLQVKDTCSAPCCDCPELKALAAEIRKMGNAEVTVRTFVGRLDAEISKMQSVVIGSRTGETGCNTCT
jgi:hypothetical protein